MINFQPIFLHSYPTQELKTDLYNTVSFSWSTELIYICKQLEARRNMSYHYIKKPIQSSGIATQEFNKLYLKKVKSYVNGKKLEMTMKITL